MGSRSVLLKCGNVRKFKMKFKHPLTFKSFARACSALTRNNFCMISNKKCTKFSCPKIGDLNFINETGAVY